jgi:hypothetical protein
MKISGTVQEKLFQLASLKKEAKELESYIKELQTDLIDVEGVACDTQTPFGKLAFQTRENYEILDKTGLVKFVGQKAYNANSSISKTGVEKAIGQLGFQEVLDKHFMAVKKISEFFVLRK